MSKMQRALISLTDKSGIEDFARKLQDLAPAHDNRARPGQSSNECF